MKIGKETIEESCKFDIDLSSKEAATLKEYGLKNIQNDDAALINYAVNKMLRDYISTEK